LGRIERLDPASEAGSKAGVNAGLSGWSVDSIVTLQAGFPFTPQLSYNPANNGDTRNPVRPFLNPDGDPAQARAMVQSERFYRATGGFYGNLVMDTPTGPGLATWDLSVLKDTSLDERLHLQFRAEIFNLLNRANFNTPNLIVVPAAERNDPPGVPGTAGAITSTSTTARQIQFGLKLLW
jgi:hypothetical protein